MKPNAFLLHSPYNTSLPKEYDVSWKQNLIEKLLLCFSNQIYIYIYLNGSLNNRAPTRKWRARVRMRVYLLIKKSKNCANKSKMKSFFWLQTQTQNKQTGGCDSDLIHIRK